MGRRARDTVTGDLFPTPQAAEPMPATFDRRDEIARIVSAMLSQAEGDRFDIAARVSRLTDHECSKWMLDAYASTGRDRFNLPLWMVPALETACDSHALTDWLAAIRGARTLYGHESLDAELGRLVRERDLAASRVRQLRKVVAK